ncbi:hypothetical protein HX004_06480 [Myroides sp. 1354]|uniref:hypothetical protein n=1 Tax=unclassified Myroides TaxID=2642485 RepID=UPI0025790E3F|nr:MULTISPECIES: hypothetical protein [unclassified Myroides]MDM1044708.1 hypothetical protein [Myroides sp. R163-1]MDM1055421.1 hypothetical protein [Myroides sp. 1354]MDM1068718.1 hypothetical protein [Myroides sp. 1372]
MKLKFGYCFFLVWGIFLFSSFSKKKEDPTWNYEIECAGSGNTGTYLVKIWTYDKKASIAENTAKKNAVHAVLFKGFTGNKELRCQAQKPIVTDTSIQYSQSDYFNAFFGEQFYLKYVALSSPTPEVIKTGKKQYKIGYVVTVSKDLLRSDLEKAGIIRGLSTGFN